MKPVEWLGDSRKMVQAFPSFGAARAGFELRNIQLGVQPNDSKPLASVGRGVEELRVWDESGTYRLIYIARLEEAVYVLHAFQKKTQQTSQRDVALARARFEQLMRSRK
jgi:phage-related protein